MYKKELDGLLAKGETPKSIALFGDSNFFIEHYAKKIAMQKASKEQIERFYFDAYDFESAKRFISSGSLFGDVNFLIIKHTKMLPKIELQTLIDICEKNTNSFFIYEYYGEDRKKLSSIFKQSVRFFKPNYNESREFLLKEAQQLTLDIGSYEVTHLLKLLDNNLELAINELAKLRILDKKIAINDIDALVYPMSASVLDTLIKDILLKREFIAKLKKILLQGESEVRILNFTSLFIHKLFLFHLYIKLHGHVDSKAILGYKLPKFIEEEFASLALKFKLTQFQALFDTLLAGEFALKKATKADKEAILLSTLIKLQAKI